MPLRFPVDGVPMRGALEEVAPGVLWARIPLPFRLEHVNVYFLRDEGGWAVFDTGICTEDAIDVWERLLAVLPDGGRITRVIVSHSHPDHIGLAGWLCERFDAPLLTSHSAYAACRMALVDPHTVALKQNLSFFHRYGRAERPARISATQELDYLRYVSPLPDTFCRLLHGDTLTIGGRRFLVLTGDGHACEQVMLYCKEDRLFLAADQVLERITPNVGVSPMDPTGDPLGHYIRTLRTLPRLVADDALVLPGHMRPFFGLHRRCAEIAAHHRERCLNLVGACRQAGRSMEELVPLLFEARTLNDHEMSFAFNETVAHVNYMVRRGDLEWGDSDGRQICRATEKVGIDREQERLPDLDPDETLLVPATATAEAALASRKSIRRFLPTEVDRATIARILALAGRAASGSNIQPWKVWVLSGDAREKLSQALLHAHETDARGHADAYTYYPAVWREPYLSRRRKVGWGLYSLLGIARGEKEKMKRQLGRNYTFFDAPVGLIFTIDRDLPIGSWLDYGIFLGNIMVAARGFGLDTCPQQAFAKYHRIVREHLDIPDDQTVICGMALGWADRDAIEYRLETERMKLDEFVTFVDR